MLFLVILHPKSSIGRNRESGSLSVYLLYTSGLKPEWDLIGSPKKLIQLQNPLLNGRWRENDNKN